MSVYFLDSSALAKCYVAEIGTDWLLSLMDYDLAHYWLMSRITWVEVLSALRRRQREGTLTTLQVDQAISAFRHDWDTRYQIVELDQSLTESAGHLVGRHPLRAYDAVQLASAIRVHHRLVQAEGPSLIFMTADVRLLKVAEIAGLEVDNPNDHPAR